MSDKKSKIMDDTYIVIQSWMVKKLGLKDKELLVYALVYGFSQDGESWFSGSLQFIAEWLCIDRKHVYSRYLKPLLDKGLLIRDTDIRNGVEFPKYRAVKPDFMDVPVMGEVLPKREQSQNGTGAPKLGTGCSQNGTGGAPGMGTNNIKENIEEKKMLLNIKNGFDADRFVSSRHVAEMISRMDEASYSDEWSSSIVAYVADCCSRFGPGNMERINALDDEGYSRIFQEAMALIDKDQSHSSIRNPDAYMSSVISRQIENLNKKMEADEQ